MITPRTWRSSQSPVHGSYGAFYTFMSMGAENVVMSAVSVAVADSLADSSDEASGWTLPEQDLSNIIANSFKEVPGVRSICARLGEDDVMSVWTLLESYDREARRKVHEKELVLCQTLHVYNFDFRVTSQDLVSAAELVAGGFREVYRHP